MTTTVNTHGTPAGAARSAGERMPDESYKPIDAGLQIYSLASDPVLGGDGRARRSLYILMSAVRGLPGPSVPLAVVCRSRDQPAERSESARATSPTSARGTVNSTLSIAVMTSTPRFQFLLYTPSLHLFVCRFIRHHGGVTRHGGSSSHHTAPALTGTTVSAAHSRPRAGSVSSGWPFLPTLSAHGDQTACGRSRGPL
jgi:hypothetical protein